VPLSFIYYPAAPFPNLIVSILVKHWKKTISTFLVFVRVRTPTALVLFYAMTIETIFPLRYHKYN